MSNPSPRKRFFFFLPAALGIFAAALISGPQLLRADPPPAAPEYSDTDSDTTPDPEAGSTNEPFGNEPAPNGERANSPFDIILQDDSNAETVILINSFTGDYQFASPPKGKAQQAAEGYMGEKGVDPSSAAGQVVKPYVVGTTVVDPGGSSSYRYQYDANGKPNSRTWLDADGKPLGSVTFDPDRGKVESLSIFRYNPDGSPRSSTQFEYDSQGGSRRTTTDPAGNTTREVYDAKGKLISSTQYSPDGSPLSSTQGETIPIEILRMDLTGGSPSRRPYRPGDKARELDKEAGKGKGGGKDVAGAGGDESGGGKGEKRSTEDLQKIIEELYEFPMDKGVDTFVSEMEPMPQRQGLDFTSPTEPPPTSQQGGPGNVESSEFDFRRDLQMDRFFIPENGGLLPATAGGIPSGADLGGEAFGFEWEGGTFILDPQLDTGGAAANGATTTEPGSATPSSHSEGGVTGSSGSDSGTVGVGTGLTSG